MKYYEGEVCTGKVTGLTVNGKPIDPITEWPTLVSSDQINEMLSYINERKTYPEYREQVRAPKRVMLDRIEKVIFNDPATIVLWSDGSKTVVKCENEKFDPEKGLAMAIAKKLLGGNQGYYYEVFKKWVPKKKTHSKKVVLKAVEKVRKDFDKEQVVRKYKY